MVIAGGVVAVAGGVLAGVGGAIGYGKNLNAQNVPPGEIDSVITARTLTTVGFVGVGVGALTAVVGAILWGTAEPAPVTNVSLVPFSGLKLRVHFPKCAYALIYDQRTTIPLLRRGSRSVDDCDRAGTTPRPNALNLLSNSRA